MPLGETKLYSVRVGCIYHGHVLDSSMCRGLITRWKISVHLECILANPIKEYGG